LVRSAERQQKEEAMHARFRQRIETALTSLAGRIARAKKPIDRSATERQIGRLLGRNSRAAARYQIRLVDDPATPAGLRLEWSARSEWDEWSRTSEGCYVLRTNLSDWTSEDLWRTYIHPSEAEAAFRIHKSELSLRPIWHQREDRVLAHILVCFLAYVLWKTLEQWQSRAGLGNAPRTILEELSAIQSTNVVLPTATAPQRELRLRCVVRPDRAQAALLDRLGPTHSPAPKHAYRHTPNVVPNLDPKSLKTLTRTPETAEVGLVVVTTMGIWPATRSVNAAAEPR
jgi:transposase